MLGLKRLSYAMIEGVSCREECLAALGKLQIAFKLYEHPAVWTMAEMEEHVKLERSPLIKALLFSDKKPQTHFMLLAHAATRPQKVFWKQLATTNNNVRMAKEEVVQGLLRSKKGALNPFALANDRLHHVKKLVIDELLLPVEFWAFHPMDNTATVELAQKDFYRFLDHFGISHIALPLTDPQEGNPAQEKLKEKPKDQPKEKTLLGVEAKKGANFSGWYQEVIIKAGLIEYYDISGCYILRPWAYGIWQRIQAFFDALIKEDGVENAYFPMFVSQKSLQIEKDHVEGFAPEVAWVTRSGTSELHEPIAIRPTSETIMYPAYAKWIQSHRDLPLKLNQWSNVVRWEFKHPTPFIRTREFLWQEGHTAHATIEEADLQMFTVLDFYQKVYRELLAVPVCRGIKSASEKFPGGLRTSTVQTWIPQNGRAIQAATSHNLGQNFAKMFNICFQDEKKERQFAWQTSWGLTTRSIGIVTMYHGDDKGLVLPPRIASTQIVIVPVPYKGKEEQVVAAATHLLTMLRPVGLRLHLDLRDNYNPGWKYNHWELKGVPIRLELGPKDIEAKEVRCVLRFSGEKMQLRWDELAIRLPLLLEDIQRQMYERALARFHDKQKEAVDWPNFISCLNGRNVVLTPWCGERECEDLVKEKSATETKQENKEDEAHLTGQAKTLCIPLEYKPLAPESLCFHCAKPATVRVLWGRSY